ncbi:hypothetical protein [Paenibacillus sp. GP183]|uniref:hypothetical protein n=1 Tax=Paenibacillus sp. GP183 TaxID=1882751 RepID=UPI000899FF3E|nr:hypothetical protein [Paenibacillus sp. GP183]SEB93461.1 hypothetical protein SAMN05443246_2400 [Paenibacillus sp. GP183]
MTNKNKQQELKIASVSFVHDPEAAKKWFEIYVESIKEQLINELDTSICLTDDY